MTSLWLKISYECQTNLIQVATREYIKIICLVSFDMGFEQPY